MGLPGKATLKCCLMWKRAILILEGGKCISGGEVGEAAACPVGLKKRVLF